MREVAFIRQNKKKWIQIEEEISKKTQPDPDRVTEMYLTLMNDLAYASSNYKKSKLVDYLNELSSIVHQYIYKSKKQDWSYFLYFFQIEIPLLIFKNRKYVFYSFLIFSVSIAIGVLSATQDDSFIRLILGDAYVNETLENIENGNPTAIYSSGSNWGSFIGITFNNIKVGLTAYVYGIFGGIGTAYILMENGIMLGAFQYMFYEEGVFWESVRGIWIHGSMEIFAIVIEGAAGLMLGASILFPRTFTRLQSFKRGFKDSLKIVISTIPFTIAAGFLEGFVTRFSNSMPTIVSMLIILISLSFISYYYIIYPYILTKKYK